MNEPIFDETDDTMIRAIVWIIAIISLITPFVMGFICCKKAKEEHAHQGDVHGPSNKSDGHGHTKH